MKKRIQIEFEKGGKFVAVLLFDKAPQTCEVVWNHLPLETTAVHGRVPGRQGKEIALQIELDNFPQREYQTVFPDRGNVTFWAEWDGNYWQETYAETIGIYYGVGYSRDIRGDSPLNVFAQILPEQLDQLEAVGIRIWRQGQEKVTISKISDQ